MHSEPSSGLHAESLALVYLYTASEVKATPEHYFRDDFFFGGGGGGGAGCFAWFVFLLSHDCCVPLPRGAMGLSAVCDCDIS